MITWSISRLQRYTSSDTVCEVVYKLVKTEGDTVLYTVDGNVIELDGDNTIPFEDLTPEIVIGWVKAALGTEGVQEKEDMINDYAAGCAGLSDTFPTNWPS